MKFAAVYNRTSSGEPEEKLIKDGEEILSYIKEKGLILKTTYQDIDKSALDYWRPAFKEMLRGAIAHDFDCLVVPQVYKLTRSIPDLLLLVKWLNSYGVTVYFCDAAIEAGPLSFEEAFDGMVKDISNETINGELDDEIDAGSEDLEKCLSDFEVLSDKLVN